MSEGATTVAESEGNQPATDVAPAGSPDDGSTTAVKSEDAGSLASSGEATSEARVREWQARHDKVQAELERVKAQLSSDPAPAAPETERGPSVFDAMAMYDAKNELKTEFPHADPSVFADLSQYGNVDELRVAADRSHTAKSVERAAIEKEVEAKLREQLKAAGVELKDTEAGPPSGAIPASTKPTLAQISQMSFAERDAYEAEHGKGSLAKILTEQSSSGLYKGGLDAE